MKNTNNPEIQSTFEMANELLSINAQILFLPSGCQNLIDSNYEFYLDCDSPESAIRLMAGRKPQVAIGDGCNWLALLRSNGTSSRINPAVRNRIRAEVERVLLHQFDNLAGQPNQWCTIGFLEWLCRKRCSTRLVTVLEYFLLNSGAWLIGLPVDSRTKELFSGVPLNSGADNSNVWYELRHLQVGEECTRQL